MKTVKAALVIGAALMAASSAEAYRYVDIRTNAVVRVYDEIPDKGGNCKTW